MELSHNSSPIENQVDNLCKIILKKTAEFWEDRNKAMIDLTSLISNYDGATSEEIFEVFNINVFRSLVEPIKVMIADLRSQQVRDTCTFLTRLSIITKDLMRHFLREAFESIYNASKVPNKVMSGYVDDCIISLIRHTTFKSSILLITTESKENKSKAVRERCMGYINEMLLCWDIQEKEADLFQDAIKSGLIDASVRSRELARLSYLNFRELFPKRADRLKNELQNITLKTRLEKEEEFHDQEKAAMNTSKQNDTLSLSITTPSINSSTTNGSPQKQSNNSNPTNKKHNELTTSTTHNHIHNNHHSNRNHNHNENGDDNTEIEDADAILLESSAILPQNAHLLRRQTHNDDAISSIQALIRGNLVRRQSSRYAFLDTHEEGNSKHSNLDESNHSTNSNNSHFPNHIILSTVGEDNERRLSSLSEASSQPNSPEKHTNTLLLQSSSTSPLSHDPLYPHSSSRISTDDNSLSSITDSSPFHIKIGMTACVLGKDPEVKGTVQYVGQTTFASGYWVGLYLDTPTGKNDGSIQGVQYFECPPLHGLFVRPGQLKILTDEQNIPINEKDNTNSTNTTTTNNNTTNNIISDKGKAEETILRTNADTLRETLNIAYAVKVKLAKSMNILNQQLEVIENFEGRVESVAGVIDEDCFNFVSKIMDLIQEEDDLITEFRNYLPSSRNE